MTVWRIVMSGCGDGADEGGGGGRAVAPCLQAGWVQGMTVVVNRTRWPSGGGGSADTISMFPNRGSVGWPRLSALAVVSAGWTVAGFFQETHARTCCLSGSLPEMQLEIWMILRRSP